MGPMRAARLLPLCVALTGCTLIEPYPAAQVENCGNGIDDDLDGRADCADPACDGQRPEAERGPCTNGRDDDGDGRVDLADARCWPFGTVRVARCPTVLGVDATFDRLDLTTQHDATIVPLPDPTD